MVALRKSDHLVVIACGNFRLRCTIPVESTDRLPLCPLPLPGPRRRLDPRTLIPCIDDRVRVWSSGMDGRQFLTRHLL